MAAIVTPDGEPWLPAPGVPSWVSVRQVEALPAVERVLGLTMGLIAQMPLMLVDPPKVLPPPQLLRAPDPTSERTWWVGQLVHDWWLHGNAVWATTATDQWGLPAAVEWLPAELVTISPPSPGSPVRWWFGGTELDPLLVTHVRRRADPLQPWRGVGVVEQLMPTWARITDQARYEGEALSGSGVPSVVVIAPNPELSQAEADAAKDRWEETFSGPVRRPGIFPKGTEVKPLSWSPSDAQLNEARKLSLTDVANAANMDGYWLGAASAGLTYKSAGPQYLHLMRQTLGPIITQFEQVFTREWTFPGTKEIRFDRQAILGDDMGTTIGWASQAVGSGLMTADEAREYLGKGPIGGPAYAAQPQTTGPEGGQEGNTDG